MKPLNIGSLKDFKLLFKNYKQSDKQITLGELSKLTDAQAYLEEALLGDGKFSSRDRLQLKRTDFVLANAWSLYTEERAFESAYKGALQWLEDNRESLGNGSGEIGPRGPAGEKGLKGDKGDKGDKGEKGEQGDAGINGQDGANGDSAYAIWEAIEENKGKSEADFLESLKGDKGEQGIQGPIGLTGPVGSPGADGEDYDPDQIAYLDHRITTLETAVDQSNTINWDDNDVYTLKQELDDIKSAINWTQKQVSALQGFSSYPTSLLPTPLYTNYYTWHTDFPPSLLFSS